MHIVPKPVNPISKPCLPFFSWCLAAIFHAIVKAALLLLDLLLLQLLLLKLLMLQVMWLQFLGRLLLMPLLIELHRRKPSMRLIHSASI